MELRVNCEELSFIHAQFMESRSHNFQSFSLRPSTQCKQQPRTELFFLRHIASKAVARLSLWESHNLVGEGNIFSLSRATAVQWRRIIFQCFVLAGRKFSALSRVLFLLWFSQIFFMLCKTIKLWNFLELKLHNCPNNQLLMHAKASKASSQWRNSQYRDKQQIKRRKSVERVQRESDTLLH